MAWRHFEELKNTESNMMQQEPKKYGGGGWLVHKQYVERAIAHKQQFFIYFIILSIPIKHIGMTFIKPYTFCTRPKNCQFLIIRLRLGPKHQLSHTTVTVPGW